MENPGKREGIVEISENSGPMMAIERIMVNTESKNGNGKPSTSPNILILNSFDANCNKVKIHEFCDDQSKLPPYVHLDHLATQNEMQKVLEKVFCGMFARIEDKKIIWMSGKELSEALLMKLEADNAEKCFQKCQREINESSFHLEEAQLQRERYEKENKKHLMKKIEKKQLEAFEDEKLRKFLKFVNIERESIKSHQRLAFQYNKAQKEMEERKKQMEMFWKNMKKQEKEIAEKVKKGNGGEDGK